jgi:hypothetical protein
MTRLVGHAARISEKINAYRKGKRPLEEPKHRWVDKIKVDSREMKWDVWT